MCLLPFLALEAGTGLDADGTADPDFTPELKAFFSIIMKLLNADLAVPGIVRVVSAFIGRVK